MRGVIDFCSPRLYLGFHNCQLRKLGYKVAKCIMFNVSIFSYSKQAGSSLLRKHFYEKRFFVDSTKEVL
jgi:hypothetical protein